MKRRISVENGFELLAQIRFLFSSLSMGSGSDLSYIILTSSSPINLTPCNLMANSANDSQ
jgi:hypothetical protein